MLGLITKPYKQGEEDKGVKVYRKEHDGANGKYYTYSISTFKKMQDGSYKTAWIPVSFGKDIVMGNKAVIQIVDANASVKDGYTDRNGNVVPPSVIFYINEFNILDNGEAEPKQVQGNEDFMNVNYDIDSEIPFL